MPGVWGNLKDQELQTRALWVPEPGWLSQESRGPCCGLDPIKAQKSGCWPQRWWGRPSGRAGRPQGPAHAFRSELPGRRTRATAAFGLPPPRPPLQAIHPTEPPRTEASKKVAGESGEASPLISAGPEEEAGSPHPRRPEAPPGAGRARTSIPPTSAAQGPGCPHWDIPAPPGPGNFSCKGPTLSSLQNRNKNIAKRRPFVTGHAICLHTERESVPGPPEPKTRARSRETPVAI